MPQPATVLEICRTNEVNVDPLVLGQLVDMNRLNQADEHEWPEERLLIGECVLMAGAYPVGFGRLIWDAHMDEVPRVIDMAVLREYRTSFLIEALESELIAEYALDAEGGNVVRGYDGHLIDVIHAMSVRGYGDMGRSQRYAQA